VPNLLGRGEEFAGARSEMRRFRHPGASGDPVKK
jgi:hypothetical protein